MASTAPSRPWWQPWWPWLALALRLVLGGVWVVAGWLKIPDPAESVRAVRAYQLLPEAVVPTVGYVLPILELVVGLCLIAGLLTRLNAAVSSVLLVAFIFGIASAWARGLEIECGCFGGGGGRVEGASEKYPWELARDLGLLTASLALIWRPRTAWALDNRVLPDDEWKEPSGGEDEVEGDTRGQRAAGG